MFHAIEVVIALGLVALALYLMKRQESPPVSKDNTGPAAFPKTTRAP